MVDSVARPQGMQDLTGDCPEKVMGSVGKPQFQAVHPCINGIF